MSDQAMASASVPQVDATVENALSGLSSALEHSHEIVTELHDALAITLTTANGTKEGAQPAPMTTVDTLMNHIQGLDVRARHLNERLTQALSEARRLR